MAMRVDVPRPIEDEPELTKEQIEELRQKMERRRAELALGIEAKRRDERSIEREVGDEMDEATAEGDNDLTSKLLERELMEMREIDRALAKIAEGSYGFCEGTGEPIGYARLSLRPTARFSVAYQEELERRGR